MATFIVTERQVYYATYTVEAKDEAEVKERYRDHKDWPEEQSSDGDEFEITHIEELQEPYECANCSKAGDRDWFKEAKDLSMRMEPGKSTYTDRECPDCGALAYPIKKGGD